MNTDETYTSYGLPVGWDDVSDIADYDPEGHGLAQASLASLIDSEDDGDTLEATVASAVGPAHKYLGLRPHDLEPKSTRTQLPEAPNHGGSHCESSIKRVR